MQVDFALVGAGIAGLTAAISLKKMGYSVCVYEAQSKMEGIGAGLGLSANAMRAFSHLDMAAAVETMGMPIDQLAIRDAHGRPIITADTEQLTHKSANSFTVHRAVLHQYLVDQLNESDCHLNKRIRSFTQDAAGVHLIFSDETTARASYLLACDGVGSKIRQQLVPNAKPRFAGYTCWRAVIDNPGEPLLQGTEVWGTAGRFGCVPLLDNQLYWFACCNISKNQDDVRQYKVAQLYQRFENYAGRIPKLIAHTRDSQLLQNDIVDLKPLKQFAFDRVLLLGDAAHATTPNLGQGACMAIEDVAVLARELQLENHPTQAFKNFESKRLARAKYIINTSRRMGLIAQLDSELACEVRNFIFRNVPPSFTRKQLEKLLESDIFSA